MRETSDCKSETRGGVRRDSASRWAFVSRVRDSLLCLVVLLLAVTGIASAPLGAAPFSAQTMAPPVQMPGYVTNAVAGAQPAPVVSIAAQFSTDPAHAVYGSTSEGLAWAILAITLSLIALVNLTFIRHLSRVYAMPQKRRSTAHRAPLSPR